MWKERALTPDYGDLDAPKYYAWSQGGINNTTLYYSQICENLVTLYEQGRGMASTTVPYMTNQDAHESIESSQRRKPFFNNCVHKTRVARNVAYGGLYAPFYGGPSRYFVKYWRVGLPAGVTSSTDFSLESLAPYWADTDLGPAQRAWWSMQPRFEGEVQGLNFLYELKDFRDIVKFASPDFWTRSAKRLKKFRREVDRSGGALKAKDTLADVTRTAAQARLVYSFAIKPLISDIMAITEQLFTLADEAQKDFVNRGKIRQTSHYTERMYSNDATVPGSANSYIYAAGKKVTVDFTATLEYRYEYRVRNKWNALKRYWGLEFNAETVWEAIPFSFLLDYVCTVGRAIHMMSKDENVSLLPMQYCESLLLLSTSGYHLIPSRMDRLHFPCDDGSHLLNGHSTELFHRRISIPNKGLALPRLKKPTSGQLWNVMALARAFW